MAGQSSDVRVSIAGIEMGRASHAWTSARERWRAAFDAVPVGDPPYIVRVADRAIVVGARRRPLRVEIYEPRPSWASTFVRRALETDPRFQVASVSMTSRGIASRAGEAVPLIDANLDRFDVVAIGGLDRLTAADVRAVDRFMRERGGAVFLLPDARLEAGPARDLIPVELKERLLERPTKLATQAPSPAFEASELLVATDRSPERLALHVIASTTGGDAFIATDKKGLEQSMHRILDKLEKTRFEAQTATMEDLFPYFLVPAVFLIALEAIVRVLIVRRFP